MQKIDDSIIETIKLVADLNSMGEKETASIIGEKIIEGLGQDKDGILFKFCYDTKQIKPKNDVLTLLNASFLSACLQELYKTFKTITGGSKAQYWFNSKGTNNPDLHRFFEFIIRDDKSIALEKDVSIIANTIKALKNNPCYKIPGGLSQYDLNRFFTEIYQGKIRVSKEGIH